ncbi:MAG TPA: squalene--hopene cyclase [Chthoniobacteraceae bacterium]|nr:squalene--hopene cyclase [Chthoniobacteraceae bacterium]
MNRSLDLLSPSRIAEPEGAFPLPTDLDRTVSDALGWLKTEQNEDGFWAGMLQSNCCMEAQWILGMHVLGITDDPKRDGVIRAILREQREDGSWEVFYNAPMGDINTTVECYAALRCSGFSPEDEPLRKARAWIFENDGLRKIRNFTRIWLALIGEWPWEHTPAIPPEMIFLPTWAPFNIYWFASWARATIMPLAIVSAREPVRPLPEGSRLDELFPDGRDRFDYSMPTRLRGFWPSCFRFIEKVLHRYIHYPLRPGREEAIRLCLEWIIRHQDADGAWGGIQPPWIYSLMALHIEGYAVDHPVLHAGIDAWNHHWSYERHGATYLQASESPIWDTLLAMQGILDCGETVGSYPQLLPALDWILSKQIFVKGDWARTVKGVECGGWAFERANTFYPDLDDTAVALTVLVRLRPMLPESYRERIDRAIRRAEVWVRAMQSSNGGWGAFDKDNNRWILTQIPFCDFGEVLDPPSADLTGHKLEAFGLMGYTMSDPAIRRAVDYVMAEQEPEGSWFGRWGVNHLYGTALVLPGLQAIGFDMNDPRVLKAGDWIIARQDQSGGWGESCESYMDDAMRGLGPVTASQTAWALIGLLAIGNERFDPAIRRGVAWLVAHQREGTWDEPHYTGCGFPGYGIGERINLKKDSFKLAQGRELARGFMINYNLYRHYFPLQALGRARDYFAGKKNGEAKSRP